MPAVNVRNLPEETHRAIKERAARNGRSAEAEIRAILEAAVRPEERVRVGTTLAAFGRRHGGLELDVRRDRTAAGSTAVDRSAGPPSGHSQGAQGAQAPSGNTGRRPA